jgi:N-acetylneuraminate lyase
MIDGRCLIFFFFFSRLKTIIIHIGTGNLRDSQELARHAQDVGADAISCVSPTYFKPETIDDYISYMAQVAAAAPRLPFYLYDIDFITGLQFSMDEFLRLAKPRMPTLRGLKHTSPSFPSMNTLLVRHSNCQVFLGSDELFLEALAIGIDVTICNSYLGHVLNRLKEAFDKADLTTARLEQNRALEVCNIRRKYGLSFPGGTKAVLRAIGLDVGQPRSPLSPVTEATVEKVRQDLKAIGFFEWGLKK